MERISEEARLLCSNDIKTTKELSLYMNTLNEELKISRRSEINFTIRTPS